MGCCMSTSTRSTAAKHSPSQNPQHPLNRNRRHRRHLPESDTSIARTPPPPPHEEETVKEVLSETPILKPTRTTTHHAVELEEEKKVEPKKPEMRTTTVATPMDVSEVSEVSVLSEMYSTMSESFSASTMAEKREDEVTSGQCGQPRQRFDRSPARKRPYSGELVQRRVRSPAKRSEPVQRTNVGSRTVRRRESGHATAKRRNVGPAGICRDDAEISGRRSRSPVTRKEGVPTRKVAARGQALKMTGHSGDRFPVASDNSEGRHLAPANESLENPLVSLECFIFL